MPDFNNGKIYKLWSPQGNEIYIGSTTQPLYKRLNHHKSYLKYTSKYLFENYDVVKIELIEEYPCNNKMELVKKEGEHIRNNTCLNKVIPDRTRKEYNEDNKEYIKEVNKQYYQNNKEHIQEQKKEYRENNKEDIKKYMKKYVEKNKEKLQEYRYEKIICDCGGKYIYQNKARHLKTKSHIDFTQQQQEQQPLE
jgi:hypothetical protein